ncbi:uncharacterized protein LOC100877169 isoform X1 [Megachile rotundata]|uniref:uncharacterized protein LOC100877169 isoform X1 n=1 Tax=Megachile rotundata TaxID=143995 RepID=UPI00061510BC|nr:PREDICTED: uncharacterized protein LOC100877169 [Megachile rotundata]
MENVGKVIELLQRRRAVREKHFANVENSQVEEYNNLMETLQTLKDDRNECKEDINKNLQRLTAHKHSIYKLIHNSENTPGLPVSHDHHRQTIMLLSEGIDFINKLQNVYKNFDNENKENNVNSVNLIHNITSCTNSVGSELHKIKSLIAEIQILQNNVDLLNKLKQEYYLNASDEDMDI